MSGADGKLRVSVAFVSGALQREVHLRLDRGSTIAEAIAGAGIARDHPLVLAETAACGVWGKVRPPEYRLRDGDRVELYPPLRADPKAARRQKAERSRKGG